MGFGHQANGASVNQGGDVVVEGAYHASCLQLDLDVLADYLLVCQHRCNAHAIMSATAEKILGGQMGEPGFPLP